MAGPAREARLAQARPAARTSGLLTVIDGNVFVLDCRTYSRWRKAEEFNMRPCTGLLLSRYLA